MNLQTVSEISKKYGISTRMLRYYEQNGLIASQKKEGYSYRAYDGAAAKRLQQVIILRKLQIPVKQIRAILNNPDALTVVEVFKQNIESLDSEITALSTIKKILGDFVSELEAAANLNLGLNFLDGDTVLDMTGSLSLIQKNIKEKVTMTDLNQATETLTQLRDEDTNEMSMKPETTVAIWFDGNCRQAMEHYAKIFKVEMWCKTMGELADQENFPIEESVKDKVGIGNLKIYDLSIRFFDYCSSCSYGTPFIAGNNIMLHLEIIGVDEARRVFDELKDGGEVREELQEQFFAALQGIVKDKFGIYWNILAH